MLEYAVVKKEPPSLSGLKQQIFIAHHSWIPHFYFVSEKPVIHDFFTQLRLRSWTLWPCKGIGQSGIGSYSVHYAGRDACIHFIG